MTPDWKIFYADGSTFDSLQGEPSESPKAGVICIVYPDEEIGRQIMHKWDFYYWHPVDKKWWGTDIFGIVIDLFMGDLPHEAGRSGRNTANGNYQAIMERADKDPDFPPKSGKRLNESPQPRPGVTSNGP